MGSTESKSTEVADAYLLKGIEALSVGKTIDAIQWLEAANVNGNPKGLTLIAGLFEDGLGVEADFNKAH